MGKNTKIIEFNGIPACGKSTLANSIKFSLETKNFSIGLWEDITNEFKKQSLKVKINYVSDIPIIDYLKLFLSLKLEKKRKWYYYWFAIKISIIYSWCKRGSKYDFVLIDHGYIQHAVSLLCGDDISTTPRYLKNFERVIKKQTPVDIHIECDISIEEVQKRIKSRKRDNGRLDIIDNYELQKNMYKIEKFNLECINKYLREHDKSSKFIKINTEVDIDKNTEYIIKSVLEGKKSCNRK
ncbi:MAG: hypothetical protein ACLSXF_11630 [Clostridium sp.]